MSEHPKVAAARAAAAAARAISAEAAAAAARADADAAAAAVDAAEADVAATEAAVRHRAKRMRALDWEAIVGIYDRDGNSALDPGEFVEVIYDALRMTGPLTHDGAIQAFLSRHFYPGILFYPGISSAGGARPTSLGGGRARLSAAAGGLGGGVSPPDLPLSGSSGFGADRRLRHACEVSSRRGLGAS